MEGTVTVSFMARKPKVTTLLLDEKEYECRKKAGWGWAFTPVPGPHSTPLTPYEREIH